MASVARPDASGSASSREEEQAALIFRTVTAATEVGWVGARLVRAREVVIPLPPFLCPFVLDSDWAKEWGQGNGMSRKTGLRHSAKRGCETGNVLWARASRAPTPREIVANMNDLE